MSTKLKHRRKLSAIFSFVLTAAIVLTSSVFPAVASYAADPAVDILVDFESYDTGALTKGGVWVDAAYTNIVQGTSIGESTKCMELADTGSIVSKVIYGFTPLSRGKVEWWVKAQNSAPLIFKIQNSNSSIADAMGFYNNNKFIFNHGGSNEEISTETYQPGKWYRFTLIFDTASSTSSITISDITGAVVCSRQDMPFNSSTFTSIKQIKFETMGSTGVGSFYIDNIHITDSTEIPARRISGISLEKADYSMHIGDSDALKVIGEYDDYTVDTVTEGNQYVSSDESVVSFTAGGQFRANSAGEATLTVTNGEYSATADVVVSAAAATLTGISLAKSEYNLNVGQTGEFQVIGSFDDNSTGIVTEGNQYVSSNPGVIDFVNGGQFIANAVGNSVITVTNGVYSAEANVTVFEAGAVLPYKNIMPRELQRETALNQLTIITPPEADWMQAGEAIAGKLLEKWGINANVVASVAEQVGDGWTGNAIVLGNLGNNPHIARLYGLYLAYTDAVHPGAGGYQLQTVIDPFGKGGNTILLGASDLEGLNDGVAALNSKLDGLSAPVLPWQSESRLSEAAAASLPYGEDPTAADVQVMLDEADEIIAPLNPDSIEELDAVNLIALLNKLTYYGKLYCLTNDDDGYGAVYYYYFKAYADFLNNSSNEKQDDLSNAQKQLFNQKNMWQSGYPFIAAYNVMEASPLFSDNDRKRIVSAIYLTYEANRNDSYLKKAPTRGARYNHDVFPALSIMFGSSYFMKYYDYMNMTDMQVMQEWYGRGEEMFTDNTSNINLDEGSDYLMHVPAVTLEYAMATGDTRFLAQGLRPSADLYAMMIDNLGTMSGGGDVYPFGYSGAYSWGHSQVLNAASWFFGEPVYQYLLERTKTGPFNGQNMPDLTFPFHRYVTDKAKVTEITGEYPTVQAYPVEQGVYDELQKTAQLDVPVEDTFHKLVFREGFDLNDAYLMLDGFGAGTHGHKDANTILKYSANGRIFIDDRDYIEKAPKNHIGMVIVKDGVQGDKPPLAKLEWAADAGGIGISKSVIPNYNGTDWTRSIISPDGKFFLIYDDVQVNQSGKYILENTWQTLGSLNIDGDRYDVSQDGATMNIQSLDESDLRQYERYGHFIKYWETVYPYPYADEEHVLREAKDEREYEAGDVSRFINVLSNTTGAAPAVNATRVNDKTVLIEESGNEWYAYWGALDTADFASDGKFHLIGDNEILSAETTSVHVGSQTIKFDKPVIFKLNTSDGSWEAYETTEGLTTYDADGNPTNNGTYQSGTATIAADLVSNLKTALNVPGNPEEWQKPEAPQENGDENWEGIINFGEEVTSSFVADINGDGDEELLLGGVNGKVQVFDSDGVPLWSFQSQGRVNEVTADTVNGEPLIFVGTENWYVHVIDKDGIEKWSVEIPNTPERREQKGNLIGVTNIRVANIDETEPWIMVGTQFRYLYGFDLQGTKRFEDIAYYYGIEDMEFMDFDGDGEDEGMLALEYYYGSILDEGALLLKRYGSSTNGPGPGYKALVKVEEWSVNGEPGVFFGTKQNYVHFSQWAPASQPPLVQKWKQNVGGEVNDTLVGDFDGDGGTDFLAVSDGFQVYCLKADGSINWKTTLGDRAMKIDAVNSPDGFFYVVAADNGRVYILDTLGAIKEAYTFAGLVQDVFAGAYEGTALVVLDNGLVYEKSIVQGCTNCGCGN